MKIARLMCVVLFAASVTPFAQAHAATKVRMLLDWAYQGPQALFTYAADKGYFADEGLDVTVDRGFGSTDSVVKLASGAYDIAFGDINSMMEFNTKNPGKRAMVAVMMLYDRAPLCVVSLDDTIKTPKDLEGKTLVTTRGAADLTLFPLFARNAGVDVSKITYKYVAPNLREAMLLKKQANASTAFYHTSYISLKALNVDVSKLKVFMYSDFGVALYGNAIMTTVSYAHKNPDTLKAFNRALAHAVRDVVANPQVAIPSIKRRDGTTDEAMELERLKLVINQSMVTPYVKAHGFGGIDPARMDIAIDQVKEALNLPKRPAQIEVFDPQYLPPVAERMLK